MGLRGVEAAPHPGPTPGAAADSSTRRRVIRSILQHGPSTAVELAERLGLTAAAIRRHTTALEEAGHLASREQRVYGARGRGRPARVFLLTDAGRQTFDMAYDTLAIQALDYLDRRLGPGAVADFAEEVLAPVGARFAELEATPDRVDRLVEAFNDTGYVAALLPAPHGRQLCQFHCPVAHVARAHPEICIAETRVIARLLGTHVQRLATIAQGDEVCTTHLPRPLQPTDERKPS
nr:winged helix-turn-helix transcriptional regulator [Propionibacterium sp.]